MAASISRRDAVDELILYAGSPEDVDNKSGYSKSTGIYFSTRPPIHLPQQPFFSIVQHIFAEHRGSSLALVDAPSGKTLTRQQLQQHVMALAAGFDSIGVRQGITVMILAPNSIFYPVVFLAVMAIGAVITTANYVNTPKELHAQIKDSETKFIVTVPALMHKVKQSGLPLVLMEEEGVSNSLSKLSHDSPVWLLSKLLRSDSGKVPKVKIHQEDPAALLYTSGTTGVSKGAVISHKNLIAFTSLAILQPPEPDSVLLLFLPMFHIYGFASSTCSSLWIGCTLVVMPRYDFESMLAAVDRYRVTMLAAVPPIIVQLVKRKRGSNSSLASLKSVGCGAAPLGKELTYEFNKVLPGVKLRQGYGLTESCADGTRTYGEEDACVGSSGKLVPNMRAKIVDASTRRFLPPYEKGEIWLQGPTIIRGYLKNVEATAMTIDREGWLHTGDIGFFNDNGYLFVVDRLKELIKYKSFQVAPAELEAVLTSHPEIMDAAVIRFPDDEAGEIPMAFVVRSPDSTLDEEKVITYVASQVSPYKKVRKVAFIDAIPKSQSGKILRRELFQLLHSKL